MQVAETPPWPTRSATETETKTMKKRTLLLLLTPMLILPLACQDESAEDVLSKYNSARSYDEVAQYLTGILKSQFESLEPEIKQRLLAANQMKDYAVVRTLSGDDDVCSLVVTNAEKAGDPLLFRFVNEDNHWKLSFFLSAQDVLFGLVEGDQVPRQFHSENSFVVDDKVLKMESAVATYRESGGNQDINICFYPFQLQRRDVEYMKYGYGTAVKETDKATAIASSMAYPTLTARMRTDLKGHVESLSFHWTNSRGTTSLSSSSEAAGLTAFSISDGRLKLAVEGGSEANSIEWKINVLDLPLLKKGL